VKLVVRSNLGGNLRLRAPNKLKLVTRRPDGGVAGEMAGGSVKAADGWGIAVGENPNPFYECGKTPAPIISEKAVITTPDLKPTLLYDLPTSAGKMYTLTNL
jgi:alpha-L-fucosidase 2